MEEQLGSIKCKLVSKCGFKKEKTSIIVKLWVTVVKRATKQTNKGPTQFQVSTAVTIPVRSLKNKDNTNGVTRTSRKMASYGQDHILRGVKQIQQNSNHIMNAIMPESVGYFEIQNL